MYFFDNYQIISDVFLNYFRDCYYTHFMLQMQRFLRTRIAPTPSGYLHLGNVFSFAVTVALARQSGARILLRIDDLDQGRARKEYVDDIFETLTFLDLPWDEGPRNYDEFRSIYSQMQRFGLYQAALDQLRDREVVFACDCSRTVLLRNHPDGVYTGSCLHRDFSLDASSYNWRVITSSFDLPPGMQYFVVRKRDGFPAYQLASLVDDMYFGVDLIVRGADLFESTTAQLCLAQLLDYGPFLKTTFRHHILLKNQVNEKLAKSAGAMSVYQLRKEGFSRADIFGMVGRLAGLQQPVSSWESLAPLIPVFILPVLP